jgi:hypothetical protein
MVTVLRTSRGGADDVSMGEPQARQNLATSGLSWPHLAQIGTAAV